MSIAILILLFIFVLSVIAFEKPSLKEEMLLHLYRVVRENRYHMLLTSGFVHHDWLHLIFNVVTFYFFAIPLEQIVGSEFFVVIYFGGLLASSIPDIVMEWRNPTFRTLGASGRFQEQCSLLFCTHLQAKSRSSFYLSAFLLRFSPCSTLLTPTTLPNKAWIISITMLTCGAHLQGSALRFSSVPTRFQISLATT